MESRSVSWWITVTFRERYKNHLTKALECKENVGTNELTANSVTHMVEI